jgi:hypothetical protein
MRLSPALRTAKAVPRPFSAPGIQRGVQEANSQSNLASAAALIAEPKRGAELAPFRAGTFEEVRPMATAPKRVPDPEAPGTPLSQESVREVLATRGADPEGSPEPMGYTHEHPTVDEIKAEAYAIYIAHGADHGRDVDDWLEAERRLRSRRA